MGVVSLIITHYKQRACIFLCSFNKPQPSPIDQERNQCPLHVQQQNFSLILQMQSWYWFLNIISHKQKSEFSDFRWQKASCADINLSLCRAFYWDTERYLQSLLVILPFQLKVIFLFSCGSLQGSCHFCLKDFTWTLSFGISLVLCLP